MKKEYILCHCPRCKKEFEILSWCIRDNKASCPYCIGAGEPVADYFQTETIRVDPA